MTVIINIFIFMIGICTTGRIFFFLLCVDSSCLAVATEKGMQHDSMDYFSDKYTSQAFLKKGYVYWIIPSSLFTMICF